MSDNEAINELNNLFGSDSTLLLDLSEKHNFRLTKKKLDEMNSVFNLFRKPDEEVVEGKLITEMLRCLDCFLMLDELQMIQKQYESVTLTFKDFVKIVISTEYVEPDIEWLKEAFLVFANKSTRLVDTDVLTKYLTRIGDLVSLSDIQKIIVEQNLPKNINFDQFLSL